ncbi:hypothetical protein [Tautonia plasticadhaerens]|uniref:Uncharacterized protein n=1 Tax=Tautonia plasticadhaerens TaxID=2527974 RepID=A0A518GUS4_9BACT|nr:hypothetical protein [Tautonia plasticadhaerens]QDV32334.1 hypothetical protein ElP_01620 [Tautonia plasticadhaerens]
MIRRITITTLSGLLGLLLASTGEAQYGWGGWGGGSSIQGTRAYGMGNFAAGAGQYNEQSAEARSINANTAMQFNDYVYQCNERNHQEYYDQMAQQQQLDAKGRQAIQDRHLNNATDQDIVDGDAVNAVFHWLTNPKIPHDLLVQAGQDLILTSEQVRTIPLDSAAQGIVISIERLAGEDWPDSLSSAEFKPYRDQYLALVQKARAIPDGQHLPDEMIDEGINILQQMRSLAKSQLRGPDFAEAERYLKAHVGLLQMTRKNNIEEILEKVREVKEVPLVNALNFMHAYSLQFGKAEEGDEKLLYINTLYPELTELRSRVMSMAGGAPPAPQPTQAVAPAGGQPNQGPAPPTALFGNMQWDQMTVAKAPAR